MIRFSRTKVLWIEDSTQIDLSHLIPPVRLSGKYDLTIARDASEAWEKLSRERYDIIIFDMDLLPGDKEEFQEYYRKLAHDEFGNQQDIPEKTLGAQLLRFWMGKDHKLPEEITEKFMLNDTLQPDQVGVLSVYADMLKKMKGDNFFKELGIKSDFIVQKSYDLSRRALLDLIEKIDRNKK